MKQIIRSMLGSRTFKLILQTILVTLIISIFILKFREVSINFIDPIHLNPQHEPRSKMPIYNNYHYDIVSNPELLLFTTMFKSAEKDPVSNIILKLWNSWRPTIQPLVFTSDDAMKRDAMKFGWPHLPEGPKNPACLGPPLFPNMFIDTMKNYNATFYGFSNGDMVYDDGLHLTFNALLKNKTLLDKPLLITGTRIDLDFEKYGRLLRTPEDARLLVPFGMKRNFAMDYWITTKTFPWTDVLPLTVGKPMFGRWTLAFAMENKDVIMIDTSKTINSLHLTTMDGNFSSWVKPGNECNVNVVKYGSPQIKLMQLGRPECAEIETYWNNGHVSIRERKPSEQLCKAYYNPNLKQVWMNYWDDPNHKKHGN